MFCNIVGLAAVGLFFVFICLSETVRVIHTPEVKTTSTFIKLPFILVPSVFMLVVLICAGEYYNHIGLTFVIISASLASYEWCMFVSYSIFHMDVNAIVNGKPTWSINLARRLGILS
jgi:hypothetical protein